MINTVTIYTDGSCNNKKTGKGAREGGFGVVLRCGDHKRDYHSNRYLNTTSARMEIMAIIHALEMCNPGWNIFIHSDNEYAVKTANEWLWGWISKGILESKSNADLWKRFIKAYEKHGGVHGGMVEFVWVRGHNGNQLNELADKLANKGRNSLKCIADN